MASPGCSTRPRPLILVAVCGLLLLATACGSRSAAVTTASSTPRAVALSPTRPIPGAPQTPRWLRIRIWRLALALGDPSPSTIVVKLGLRDRGRAVDRVWMRGDFVCNACSRPYQAAAPTGHLAGFTVDAASRRELSFSLSPG